jgi:hypothetical protein
MWDYFEPREGTWYRWDLNGARAWLWKGGPIWRTALEAIAPEDMNGDFGGPHEALPPESFSGYDAAGAGSRVALRPGLGEKPWLVTIPGSMRLFPGAEVRFSVLFPPELRFELSPESFLTGAMPLVISEAWVGDDTVSGQIGLSLPPFLVSPEGSAGHIPSLILGGLVVFNASKSPVELDRLVIYTGSLSLYEQGGRLFSDTVAAEILPGGDIKLQVIPFEGGEKIDGKTQNGMGDILIRRGTDFIKELKKNIAL